MRTAQIFSLSPSKLSSCIPLAKTSSLCSMRKAFGADVMFRLHRLEIWRNAETVYGERTGPNLGLSPPNRTLPLSAVMAGAARTGPKLGLSPPNRTLPASATLAGVARISMVIFSSCDCIDSLHQRRHQWRRFDATLCTEKACIISGYCMTARPLAHEHSRRLCEVALHKTLKTVC